MSIFALVGDNQELEFPDGTPESVIDMVVQRDFVQPQPPTQPTSVNVNAYNPEDLFQQIAPQATPFEEKQKQWGPRVGITPPSQRPYGYDNILINTPAATGAALMRGVSGSMAAVTRGLDNVATYIANKTGWDKGELFNKAALEYERNAEFWSKAVKDRGEAAIRDFFMEVLGGAPLGIADFSMGTVMYGLKGAAAAEEKGENEVIGAIKGAMERGLMGGLLHQINRLTAGARTVGTGALFAEHARSQGETDPRELMKAGATGAVLGATSGRPGPKATLGMMGSNARTLGKEVGFNMRRMDEGNLPGPIGSEAGAIGKLKPALKLDEEVFSANTSHGVIYDSVPTEKIGKAKTIETGYVDASGKWYSDKEAREVINSKEYATEGGNQETTLGMGLGGGQDILTGLARWLSPTAETIKSKGENVMPAEEWGKRIKAWGEKNPHVRDENEWNGIQAWVESRKGEKVSKRELLSFLEASKEGWAKWEQVAGSELPEYEVIHRPDLTPESGQWMVKAINENTGIGLYRSKQEAEGWIKANKDKERNLTGTFDQWASRNIPGGIPGTAKVYTLSIPSNDPIEGYAEKSAKLRSDVKNDRISMAEYRREMDKLDEYTLTGIQAQYVSPHFPGRPNVVLHLRTEERVDASGDKGLMVETVQSDWHQARGSTGRLKFEEGKRGWNVILDGEPIGGPYATEKEARESSMAKVPPAPFKSTWHEAGLKKVLDMAAQDPSIKWVAWPSGKVQNERWGKGTGGEESELSEKSLDKMEELYQRFIAKGSTITEAEYKKLSDAIVAEDYKNGTFLEILYDKRLPKFAKKYAEKIGGKYKTDAVSNPNKFTKMDVNRIDTAVESGELTPEEAAGEYAKMGKSFPIHRIDLTPTMRDTINTKGQPFYNITGPVAGAAAQALIGKEEDDKKKRKLVNPAEEEFNRKKRGAR